MHFSNLCSWLVAALAVNEVTANNDVQRLRKAQRLQTERQEAAVRRRAEFPRDADASSFRYLNGNTKPYQVTSMPGFEEINLGELYSGNVPIKAGDNSSSLFFMFKPTIGAPVNEVTIWFNGGPGCSSLNGFLEENGPYLWSPGAYKPEVNPYAWSNMTNVLWVEYPTGVGFSVGPTNYTTEQQAAAQFVSWFKNWQNVFGIKNYKIYVTGESYGGYYVPYVSQALLNQKDKTYYDVHGAMIYDPIIASYFSQNEAVALPFFQRFQNTINLNSTTVAALTAADKLCGYDTFRQKYSVFPPAGVQPDLDAVPLLNTNPACDVSDTGYAAATDINPCFNVYSANQQCPAPWDQLGGVYTGKDAPAIYFNRPDVKAAIHAPQTVQWSLCVSTVFANGDFSDLPIVKALPQVIESTNRVLLAAGSLDSLLGIDGLILAIQNMTWNGKLGFQSKPDTPIVITQPDIMYGTGAPQGVMGVQHQERGLLYSGTALASHMGPMSQPRVSYRHLQWLLGKTEVL